MVGESGPVEVHISCQCPGKPHDHDIVWMRAKPSLDMGLAVSASWGRAGDYSGDNQSAILAPMVRYGPVAWTCRDEDGPIPVNPATVVDRLGWSDDAVIVTRKARELYYEAVMRPLGVETFASVPPTPEDSSTSQNPDSGEPTPISSEQSSPSEAQAGKRSAKTGV